MPRHTLATWLCAGLVGCTGFAGCATPRQIVKNLQSQPADSPATADRKLASTSRPIGPSAVSPGQDRAAAAVPAVRPTAPASIVAGRKTNHVRVLSAPTQAAPDRETLLATSTPTNGSRPVPRSAPVNSIAVADDSRENRVMLLPIEESAGDPFAPSSRRPITLTSTQDPPPALPPAEANSEPVPEPAAVADSSPVGTRLDLATALEMIGGDHPAVGFAQWRVQEAYAQLERAEALWLPSLQGGFNYHLHNGALQNVQGNGLSVNSSSFNAGFGAGAIAAGTTTRPGLVAQFHLSDAIFQPKIVERDARAREFRANATYNDQLLATALAYLELQSAEQSIQIVRETERNTQALAKLTSDYARAGQGVQSDADRMETELILVQSRLLRSQERSEIASARLAQALSADAGVRLLPGEVTVLPIDLVSADYSRDGLIAAGLSNRPELCEAQNLVASACEAYKRQKYAPFVPSVLLGFSQSSFAGAVGSDPGSMDDRMDFDALMMWEVRNLGFGERAARNETAARIEQARFEQVRQMDRVAREVSEAFSQVDYRRQRIAITQQAILSAENSYARNLRRIQDGQGLPIEVLQSLQALEQARQAYLDAVVEYNQAQFRLQWSLGWPVSVTEG